MGHSQAHTPRRRLTNRNVRVVDLLPHLRNVTSNSSIARARYVAACPVCGEQTFSLSQGAGGVAWGRACQCSDVDIANAIVERRLAAASHRRTCGATRRSSIARTADAQVSRQGRAGALADHDRSSGGAAGAAEDCCGRGLNGCLRAARAGRGRVSEGAQGGPTWTDVASTNRPRWRRPRWSRSSSRRSRQPRRRIASISKASARSTAAVGSGGSSEARTARVGASRARASATPMRSSSCAVESTKPRAIVVGIRWRKAA
jgi:hypothetical protein